MQDSWLWQTAFGTDADATDEQRYLRSRLLDARDLVIPVVRRIAQDIPGLTVHDISHLDSLWDLASVVSEPSLSLNAAEGFVFGMAVLLHDAGLTLAAYPNGLADLKQLPAWTDKMALRAQQASADGERDATAEVAAEILRERHADQAYSMASQAWYADDGTQWYLIADNDLRSFYGETVGLVAQSHWWDINRIERQFSRTLGAFQPKVKSVVDVLKVATLLRVADALALDVQRAPRFERVLAKPKGLSGVHWTAQEKIAFPQVEAGSIAYSSTTAFDAAEAEAWWLMYDAVAMADKELRASDGLLREHRNLHFSVTRVRGAGNPVEFSRDVKVEGWQPVETKIRISNVHQVVEMLGGQRLYGTDANAPLRELLQNARDAVMARRTLEERPSDWGEIVVGTREDDGTWLWVEDNGVGMSSSVIVNSLLDFGSSLWRSPRIATEFPKLASSGMQPIGMYGIGFFSVFMIADKVRVFTRRYDHSKSETKVLEFLDGLRSRPVLRTGERAGSLLDGGTRVEVRLRAEPHGSDTFQLRIDPSDKVGEPSLSSVKSLADLVRYLMPTSDVGISVRSDGETTRVVGPADWQILPPDLLVDRLGLGGWRRRGGAAQDFIRDLSSDGVLLGRAAVVTLPPTSIQPEGDSGGWFGRFGRGERRGLARSWSLSGAADHPVAG